MDLPSTISFLNSIRRSNRVHDPVKIIYYPLIVLCVICLKNHDRSRHPANAEQMYLYLGVFLYYLEKFCPRERLIVTLDVKRILTAFQCSQHGK